MNKEINVGITIKNIRKADTIFNYLNQVNFEKMVENIEKLSKMEVSEIEREIRKLKENSFGNEKIMIKKGKKVTTFEIQKQLSDEDIKKINDILEKYL